jgi:glycosyltransferase involved in cell wall biosynthesis
VAATVLHVLEALEGGTSRHVIDLVRSVEGVRHEVAIPAVRTIGVTDTVARGAIESAGGRVHVVAMHRRPLHPGNAGALRQLRRLVRSISPDIVHGHSSLGGAFARVIAGRLPIPVIYTPNGITSGRGGLAVERFLGRRTDRLIAVSASEAEVVRRLGLVAAGAIRIVPNGIDLTPVPPLEPSLRAQLGIGPSAPLVGTISRLVAQKAPEDFVAACARIAQLVPGAAFVLVGSGPLQGRLDRAVAASGIGDRWHQVSDLAGAAAALGELDVFVLLSRFEGGPYAPLEAMRAGTPVVLSDVVGNRDVVVNGRSGLLVTPGDPSAAADAVTALLLDPARRSELEDAARDRLTRSFSLLAMGAATAGVYAEVFSGRT